MKKRTRKFQHNESPSKKGGKTNNENKEKSSPRTKPSHLKRVSIAGNWDSTPISAEQTKRLYSKSRSVYRTPRVSAKRPVLVSPSSQSKVPAVVKEKWEELTKRVINRTWKYCYLSSMSNFKFEQKFCSAYEKEFYKVIQDFFAAYELKVEIEPSSFFQKNVNRVDAVFITVSSLKLAWDEQDEERWIVVYEAVLIRSDTPQSLDAESCQWWPLLMFKGRESIHQALGKWAQESFGCYLCPTRVSMTNIVWLVGLWTNYKCSDAKHKNYESAKVSLNYKVKLPSGLEFDLPEDIKRKQNFNVSVDFAASDMINIWKKIKRTKSDEVTPDQLNRFHESIEAFVHDITHFPASFLQLQRFTAPCLSSSLNGSIRINCKSALSSVIGQLLRMLQSTCDYGERD